MFSEISAHPIRGTLFMPGDKSISHRMAILGVLRHGALKATNMNSGQDVQHTVKALKTLGYNINLEGENLDIDTNHAVPQKDQTLYLGNSGTSLKLLMGLLAPHPIKTTLTGDESLSKRSFADLSTYLEKQEITLSNNTHLPTTMHGRTPNNLLSLHVSSSSAQLRSALMIMMVQSKKGGILTYDLACRDHTEKMLKAFGFDINFGPGRITISTDHKTDKPLDIYVPGDPSAAVFFTVLVTLVPNSHIIIKDILLNPYRWGAIDILRKMGANITIKNERKSFIDSIVDLDIKSAPLNATTVEGDMVPKLIDEYPILSVAAAFAKGISHFKNLERLKNKETNRLEATHKMLKAFGIKCNIQKNDLIIYGQSCNGEQTLNTLDFSHDHRMAMSSLILQKVLNNKTVEIKGTEAIKTSFPTFFDCLGM